jgi:hypothetical protein
MTFPFPDRYRAALSSFSRSRNEQENSKFHYIIVFFFYYRIFVVLIFSLVSRKKESTREENSVQCATSLVLKPEDRYHQTSTATMLM